MKKYIDYIKENKKQIEDSEFTLDKSEKHLKQYKLKIQKSSLNS